MFGQINKVVEFLKGDAESAEQDSGLSSYELSQYKEELMTRLETNDQLSEEQETILLDIETKEVAKVLAAVFSHTLDEKQQGELLKEANAETMEGYIQGFLSMGKGAQLLTLIGGWLSDLTTGAVNKKLLMVTNQYNRALKKNTTKKKIRALNKLQKKLKNMLPEDIRQEYVGFVDEETRYRQQTQHAIYQAPSSETNNVSASTSVEVEGNNNYEYVPENPHEAMQKILTKGREYIGMPYVSASKSPKNGGFDCSGLIKYIFESSGYVAPGGYSKQMYERTKENTLAVINKPEDIAQAKNNDQLRPGDLVTWLSAVPDFRNRHGVSTIQGEKKATKGAHHVALLGDPVYVQDKQGQWRLNMLQSGGKSGITEKGVSTTYHCQKSDHKSTLVITRPKIIPNNPKPSEETKEVIA